MDKPILLQKKKLVKPIEQALERIEKIRLRKVNNVDEIILEGLFALGVASFEHSISDTLKTLLTQIPDKLDLKTEPITKSQLIDGNPLNQAVENKVNAISYKSLPDIIKYFTKVTDIPEKIITEDEMNQLLEIKATRNLLIHNNLMVNPIYEETAGPNKRSGNGNGGRLRINQDYLFESLVVMRTVLEKIKTELLEKYKDFTKIKAVKNLFNYIFKTPVMNFDHEFDVDEENDTISAIKRNTSHKEDLSSSERLFFDIWVAHTHGDRFEFSRGEFFGLDKNNIKKMAYLIENIYILKT
ncbi:hypothetical protein [Yeosuana sp.]|uniref:hypothetical protein n=1 Tax=Yeosuana sp. TaxID=2529388 RepID=UPI00404AA751